MAWTCLNLNDDLHPKQWKKLITKAERILPLTFLRTCSCLLLLAGCGGWSNTRTSRMEDRAFSLVLIKQYQEISPFKIAFSPLSEIPLLEFFFRFKILKAP